MKKIFTVLLLAIFAMPILLNAQLAFTPYKAMDKLAKAKSEAVKTITNPSILYVGTIVGQLPNPPVALTFNMATGEATAWLYKFVDPNDNTKTATIAVGITALGEYPLAVPDSVVTNKLPYTPVAGFTEDKWTVNSDAMITAVKNNDAYKAYIASNPSGAVSAIAIFKIDGVPSYIPGFDPNTPYYSAFFEAGSNKLVCVTNAMTAATICVDPATSVKDNLDLNNPLTIFPNPSSDIAFLRIPSELQSTSAVITVYNTLGEKVWVYPNQSFMGELVLLPLNMLSNGKYFIDYKIGNKSLTVPITISR